MSERFVPLCLRGKTKANHKGTKDTKRNLRKTGAMPDSAGRLHGSNWLCGFAEDWDEVPTDT